MEKISKEEKKSVREKLLSLEKEGKFVFHGSAAKLDYLEPQQAFNFDIQAKKNEKHGEPCVAATPFADIAIFRAIINKKNFPDEFTSRFSFDDGIVKFFATKEILDNLNDKKGKVYILDKHLFEKFSGMEFRSDKKVKPIQIVTVGAEDLPQNIVIIDNEFNEI